MQKGGKIEGTSRQLHLNFDNKYRVAAISLEPNPAKIAAEPPMWLIRDRIRWVLAIFRFSQGLEVYAFTPKEFCCAQE